MMKLTITKSSFKNTLLGIVFVLFGFGIAKYYLLAAILFVMIYYKTYLNPKINTMYLLFMISNLAFLSLLFLIGAENLRIADSSTAFILLTFTALFISIMSYSEEKSEETIMNLIVSFTFGLFIQTIIVVGYSYLENPLIYGYGKLIDPFTMEIVNSPSYSNNLILVFVVFTYFYFFSENSMMKLLSIVVLSLSIVGGLFLSGRSFFFISGVFLFFFLPTVMSRKKLFQIVIALIPIVFAIVYFYDSIEASIQLTTDRLAEGSESNRFKHWEDAIPKILSHPMGGFSVNQMIEYTYWLHNLWLDTARAGGWLPLIALLMGNLVVVRLSFKAHANGRHFYVLLLMCYTALLIMAQDVIIEGNWKILFFYFMIVSFLLSKKNITHHNHFDNMKKVVHAK